MMVSFERCGSRRSSTSAPTLPARALRPSTIPGAGDRLGGRFDVLGEAGRGGMGVVYRARDRARGGVVAVKVPRRTDARWEERLAHEAEALRALRHPAIIGYVAHEVDCRFGPYLAMEWLRGESLDLLLARGPLEPAAIASIGCRIAEALEAVHTRGFVHADLKPHNIGVVGGDLGRIKLLDFGLARQPGGPAPREPGTIAGTPGYMAPEQISAPAEINARTDLFALGCVLYRCAIGPISLDDAPSPRSLLFSGETEPSLSPRLAGVLRALLATAPSERPHRAGEVAAELAELAGQG